MGNADGIDEGTHTFPCFLEKNMGNVRRTASRQRRQMPDGTSIAYAASNIGLQKNRK